MRIGSDGAKFPTARLTQQKEEQALGAGNNPSRSRSGIVHRQLQVNRNAGLSVGKILNANNLGNIFAVGGIIVRGIRKSDEYAHAFIVVGAARSEVDAVLGRIDADGEILKMVVAGLGGPDASGLGDSYPAIAALVRVLRTSGSRI